MKNALIFAGFIILTSIITFILLGEAFLTKENIISILIVAIACGYIFGFLLKGSFGWKNKNEDI